jgi:hypothetical protein
MSMPEIYKAIQHYMILGVVRRWIYKLLILLKAEEEQDKILFNSSAEQGIDAPV